MHYANGQQKDQACYRLIVARTSPELAHAQELSSTLSTADEFLGDKPTSILTFEMPTSSSTAYLSLVLEIVGANPVYGSRIWFTRPWVPCSLLMLPSTRAQATIDKQHHDPVYCLMP